ncbi:MAG: AAA family ATPase, partial [Anaerolineae bacterium]|nr:AAA family ATPase [Anaerolineae bacterium]
AVGHLFEMLHEHYGDQPAILDYLEACQDDVLDNIEEFFRVDDEGNVSEQRADHYFFRRYTVNVIVDSASETGIPVV